MMISGKAGFDSQAGQFKAFGTADFVPMHQAKVRGARNHSAETSPDLQFSRPPSRTLRFSPITHIVPSGARPFRSAQGGRGRHPRARLRPLGMARRLGRPLAQFVARQGGRRQRLADGRDHRRAAARLLLQDGTLLARDGRGPIRPLPAPRHTLITSCARRGVRRKLLGDEHLSAPQRRRTAWHSRMPADGLHGGEPRSYKAPWFGVLETVEAGRAVCRHSAREEHNTMTQHMT